MGLMAFLRRYRRAAFLPIATWLLLQVVMTTGVRAATGVPASGIGAEEQLLRDLATSLCLAGQPQDEAPALPSLQDRCSWCAAFAHSVLPPAPVVLPQQAVFIVSRRGVTAVNTLPTKRPRYLLFDTRAPPA